jgi:glucose/arabinose dehydrogenase
MHALAGRCGHAHIPGDTRQNRKAAMPLRATLLAPLAALALMAAPLDARPVETSAGPLDVSSVVQGLDEPWGFAFLPGGGILITERDGRLLHVTGGAARAVAGVPEVAASGQGGLLDVAVARDFAQSRLIFLSYSKPQRRGAGTALMRARLSDDGTRLEEARDIFEMRPGSSGGRHFGSRIVEAPDGTLFLSIGDRGERPSAQDLAIEAGSVVRVTREGGIPADNPLVGREGAAPAIWSWGHRNPQGLTLAPDGALIGVEHGARGGDEVNRVERGRNYGWPVISYGRHYSGFSIGEGTAREGMEQPLHYWDPSIAPSGAAFLDGGAIPAWEGDLFVGSLKFGLISRLDGRSFAEVERIELDETARTRDVRQGPDGALWFLSVGNGALYRLGPGGA